HGSSTRRCSPSGRGGPRRRSPSCAPWPGLLSGGHCKGGREATPGPKRPRGWATRRPGYTLTLTRGCGIMKGPVRDPGTIGQPFASKDQTTVSADDQRLIADCLGGDTAAFGELVRRHQDRLYNTVYRLVDNAEDALDVVQEAFLNAYQSLES